MSHEERLEWAITVTPDDILLPVGGLFDALHSADYGGGIEIIEELAKRNDNTTGSKIVSAFEIFFGCLEAIHGIHRGPEEVALAKQALAKHHAEFVKNKETA